MAVVNIFAQIFLTEDSTAIVETDSNLIQAIPSSVSMSTNAKETTLVLNFVSTPKDRIFADA